jgi:IPT/TIG domain
MIAGFQVAEQPVAFQVLPPNTGIPTPALPVYNAVSYATELHDADYSSIFGSNLSLVPNGAVVTLNGVAAPVLYSSSDQINFQIPPGTPVGPATLQLNNGSTNAFPVYLEIDSAIGRETADAARLERQLQTELNQSGIVHRIVDDSKRGGSREISAVIVAARRSELRMVQ